MPLLAWPASFDCQKARSAVEKMVCADPELSKLDAQLEQTYQGALNTVASQVKANKTTADAPSKLVKEQKNWITYQRNICTDAACLREVYQARIELLKRDPSPFSHLYPVGFIDEQAISFPRDFGDEIQSINQSILDVSKIYDKGGEFGKLIGFNQSVIDKKDPGKITGCSKLIYLPSGGTAPNAYTSAGVCMFQKEKTHALVRICLNETIGNYVIEKITKTNMPYKELIDFANNKCGVGG